MTWGEAERKFSVNARRQLDRNRRSGVTTKFMSGNNSSPWFKIFALCTALGFGGAYVWRQQQKAVAPAEVQKEAKPETPLVLSSSKSLIVDPTPVPVDDKKGDFVLPMEEPDDRVLMPGSKSGGIFIPQPDPQNPPKQRTLLPGSKNPARILEPPKSDPVSPSPETPVAPKERTLLPSSKSIPMPIFRERRIAPEDPPKPDEP